MKTLQRFFLFCSVLAIARPGLGQVKFVSTDSPPSERESQLLKNSRKVIFGLRLDKQQYMTGEAIAISVSIANPTNETLEIFDTFSDQAAGIDFLQWGDRERTGEAHFEYVQAHPRAQYLTYWNAPTVFLYAGQKIEKAVQPFGENCFNCASMPEAAIAPDKVGKYRLRFGYYGFRPEGQALVDIQVEAPKVLRVVSTRVADIVASDGSGARNQRYLYALLVEYQGKTYLIAGRKPASDKELEATDIPMSFGMVHSIAPINRLAAVSPDTKFQVAISAGKATVSWTDRDGPHDQIVGEYQPFSDRF